jgi:hypothetical protein
MHENLERLASELVMVLSGLDAREAQSTPRANPAKWNIQQIVEHLLLSYRSTSDLVQARLEKGTPTRAKPSVAQRVGQFGLVTLGFFPPGRQAPAAVRPTLPASLCTGEELARRVNEDLVAMDGVLSQAESQFGRTRFASHVVLGPLSAAQWRKFHLVHGRHHKKQILRIREEGKGKREEQNN